MFRTNKGNKLDPASTDTFIGEGSQFEGRLRSSASIRIEGRMIGDIECEGDLTIGEKGVVESNISARSVLIAGQVTGLIHASQNITITSKGRLYGDIQTASLTIDEGAVFQGSSRMEMAPASGE